MIISGEYNINYDKREYEESPIDKPGRYFKVVEIEPTERNIAVMESLEYQSV